MHSHCRGWFLSELKRTVEAHGCHKIPMLRNASGYDFLLGFLYPAFAKTLDFVSVLLHIRMFATTAQLFLNELIDLKGTETFSSEIFEVLSQIRTLISFVPSLPSAQSPKSESTADTRGLMYEIEMDKLDLDFSPSLDMELDAIYDVK